MNLAAIKKAVSKKRLLVSGVVTDAGLLPEGAKSVLLLSPDEPAFWPYFKKSEEWTSGQTDPMDRWSSRTITALAKEFGGQAIFPSDGPPYAPFQKWAMATGRFWVSPAALLVHDQAGLFASFRGAVALPYEVSDEKSLQPCASCEAPCLTACPVAALSADGYDVDACHAHLDTDAGSDCMRRGCRARRACPVGQNRRMDEQSAYHMSRFHQ